MCFWNPGTLLQLQGPSNHLFASITLRRLKNTIQARIVFWWWWWWLGGGGGGGGGLEQAAAEVIMIQQLEAGGVC